jgi:hypothetical protein
MIDKHPTWNINSVIKILLQTEQEYVLSKGRKMFFLQNTDSTFYKQFHTFLSVLYWVRPFADFERCLDASCRSKQRTISTYPLGCSDFDFFSHFEV